MSERRDNDQAVLYALVSCGERDRLMQYAKRDGVTLCQWIRECINDRLIEEGDDVPLVQMRRHRGPNFGGKRLTRTSHD